jgi:glycosyltransferase involved in cell wall biosynthesis
MRNRVSSTDPIAILIISHEIIGNRMAGPAIRYLHLSRVLSREFDVTLASPSPVGADSPSSTIVTLSYHRKDWSSIEVAAVAADVIICPTDIVSDFPELGKVDAAIVIDGYDPVWAEWLALVKSNEPLAEAHWGRRREEIYEQYLIGDFFICASARQRDWWLGLLEASGRINPYTCRDDPSLRRLVDTVPYGLPADPPRSTRRVVKGVWKGIEIADPVILWGGGLWPWLDPLTAIRAMALVSQQRENVRLIFPGTKHPNPDMKGLPTHTDEARELATKLGLLDRNVFFGDWVPYEDWPNVLLESDVALTLHGDETLESHLAFRSRVLDYVWAGLPMVATRGDATSDLIAENGLGVVTENGDVQGVAKAILRLLDVPEDYQKRINQLRPTLTWERAAQPLIEFCRAPRRAPDKIALSDRVGGPLQSEVAKLRNENARLQSEINRLFALVREYEHRRAVRLANGLKRFKDRW